MINDFINVGSDAGLKVWWKIRFVTALFPSLIKGNSDNSFPQIYLRNANAFFKDLTGKHL